MKKLFSVLMALCLLFTAVAALAEEAPVFENMPKVVTVDEGVELTDADFEGDWVRDIVFFNTTYLTPEEVEQYGFALPPMHIGDGKISRIVIDENGENEAASEYTLDSNQIQFTDEEGIEAVIEKLEDGNLVMSIFVPAEDETVNCVTVYLVPAEA